MSFLLLLVLCACSAVTTAPPPTITSTAIPPTHTSIPTATFTPTATPVPDGPCRSPFLPLKTGNEWTYRSTTGSGEASYDLKTLERDDARNTVIKVEFSDQKNNVKVIEPVVCMDGAIENFPLFVMSMHFAEFLEKDFNTYHDTGVYSPSRQTFLENNWTMNWNLQYLTEDVVQMKNPSMGQRLVMQSSFINLSFEIDGTHQAITTPAGDFPQALRILHRFSFPITLYLPTGSTGSVLTVSTTQWYEPYIGLIRSQVNRLCCCTARTWMCRCPAWWSWLSL